MVIIGLTGGIASGKSTISDMLKELGAAVIDVDLVGRDVVCQGGTAYNKIIESFGREILMSDGSINRKRLGNLVFSDPGKLRLLNEITHPAIIEKVNGIIAELKEENKKVAVVDAAILIEMGLYKYVDCVWMAAVDDKTQLRRVMERDKLSERDALNRIKAQMTRDERMKYADVVIDTTQPIDEVRKKVRELWYSMQSGEIRVEEV